MKIEQWRKKYWGLGLVFLIPLALTLLFYGVNGNQKAMDFWVYQVIGPVEQFWGRIWAIFPFSVMEIFIALFLLGNIWWIVRCVWLVLKQRALSAFFRRLLALATLWMWLWCSFCWLWNAAYYASTFAQRSGLETSGHTVEELITVTTWFAQQAAQLSSQVPRQENGEFLRDSESWFSNGTSVYQKLEQEFPCLTMSPVRAKPLVCSKFQSYLGFTGMYFPFTGEANVNIDAPACLIPSTIAHEMAHQRMVASEQEANFVGIAACLSSTDVVFQYSGFLMGLIHLCNALYPISPDAWEDIANRYFTQELAKDWTDNNNYWAALESPVEEVAGQAYDSFLKSNHQDLGIQSYGACVDLLVTYYYKDAAAEGT
jgi:hypothetical protein